MSLSFRNMRFIALLFCIFVLTVSCAVLSASVHPAEAKTLTKSGWYCASDLHKGVYPPAGTYIQKISWKKNKLVISGKIERYKTYRQYINYKKPNKAYKGKALVFKLSKKVRYYGAGGEKKSWRVSKRQFMKVAQAYRGLRLEVFVKKGRVVKMRLSS